MWGRVRDWRGYFLLPLGAFHSKKLKSEFQVCGTGPGGLYNGQQWTFGTQCKKYISSAVSHTQLGSTN